MTHPRRLVSFLAAAFAAASLTLPGLAQTPNHAIALNGINGYGSAAGVGGLYTNSTWEAWLRLPNYQPGTAGMRGILFRWGMYSHAAPMADPSTGAVTAMAPCPPHGSINTPAALAPGAWCHVAAVYTDQIRVFVNGTPVSTVPAGTCAYAGWSTLLGATANVNVENFFGGEIDEARISNSVRYTGPFVPASRFTSDANTVGLWHFDEGAGSIAYDSSPHGRHFSLQGGYAWVAGNTGNNSPAAQFTTFGAGCAGTVGVPTLSALPGSLPRLGATFTMHLADLPDTPFAGSIGYLGYSNTTAFGLALPFSMGIYGMPAACMQYIDPTGESSALVHQNSTAAWPVIVPLQPVLAGAAVHAQALVLDWPLATPLPVIATNAATMVLGY